MQTRDFSALVRARWDRGFHVCVGLDTDFDKIPVAHRIIERKEKGPEGERLVYNVEETVVQYNNRIIDATRDIVACYKPNRAFYAKHAVPGVRALIRTTENIRQMAPKVPNIVDGKWGDIGNTDDAYVAEALGFNADGVTLNPYLGEMDSLDRFFAVEGLGCFVLCRTSNPGAGEFQNLLSYLPGNDPQAAIPLYQEVAQRVLMWQTNYPKSMLGLVAGATAPPELAALRERFGFDIPLLIPGAGKQGGDEETCAKIAKKNFLINNSSKCIFASEGSDFADAARGVVLEMNKKVYRGLTAA